MRKQTKPSGTEGTAATVIRNSSGAVVVRGYQYTLGEISRGAKVSRPHITRIFNGRRGLSLKTAQKISAFLGVPIDALLALLKQS